MIFISRDDIHIISAYLIVQKQGDGGEGVVVLH